MNVVSAYFEIGLFMEREKTKDKKELVGICAILMESKLMSDP